MVRNKKGFTIIEIMVVIALIGILSAVLVPKFNGVKEKAKEAGVLTNMKSVEAYVVSAIDDCTTTAQLATKISTNFNDAANRLENPLVTTSIGADLVDEADATDASISGIVVGNNSVLVIDAGNIAPQTYQAAANNNLKGCVIVTVYNNGTVLSADIVGMGNADTGATAVEPLGKFKKTYTK